jgi:uncharacterized lipoprotein
MKMKKILLGLCVILGLINMIGCSSDEKYPMPTSIDQNSLSAEAKAGAIKLKWTVPVDSNYYYVKVTYTLPEDGKKCTLCRVFHTGTSTHFRIP